MTTTVIGSVELPDGYGSLELLRDGGGRYFVRRYARRGKVTNVIDKFDWIDASGNSSLKPLDEETGRAILSRVSTGQGYSSSFVFYEKEPDASWTFQKTDMEHKYTSTGIKFWRHQQQMWSYRDGGGDSIVSAHVSPEGACNLKCPYCSVTYRDTHARISLATIKDFVEKLQSRGLKAIVLTGGGEPTSYKEINELINWLKYERGLSIGLITNGTLLRRRLEPRSLAALSWLRVSINVFPGWEHRIDVPAELLSDDCVVGCSMVFTVEHEAVDDDSSDRLHLLRRVSNLADRLQARYVRLLPNCLLEQNHLVAQHKALENVLAQHGDERFFHQHKLHAAPRASRCHQAYFRPYLSEEPWHGDGIPGSVYPCDSVVLNEGYQHFAEAYQICRPGDILDFLDGRIEMRFDPRRQCSGCVFTENVNLLEDWVQRGDNRFEEFETPLKHEEFV